MKIIFGYLKTILNYCQNPKGHFDILDYLKFIVIFVVTTTIIIYTLKCLESL